MIKDAYWILHDKGFKWSKLAKEMKRSTAMEFKAQFEVGMKEKAHLSLSYQFNQCNKANNLSICIANHSAFEICIGGKITVATPKQASFFRVGRLQEKLENNFLVHPTVLRNQEEDGHKIESTLNGNIGREAMCCVPGFFFTMELGEVAVNPTTLTFDLRFLPINSPHSPHSTVDSNNVGAKIAMDGALSLNRDIATAKNNTTTADLTILCDGKEFKAHKFMLSARSSVFSAMFSHKGTKETDTNEVDITDCEGDTMKMFLQYIYTGDLPEATFEVAEELIDIATKYDVQPLVTACAEILGANLDEDNAIRVAILCDLYNMKDLKTAALAIVASAKKPLKSMSGWNELSKFQDLKIEIVDNKAT